MLFRSVSLSSDAPKLALVSPSKDTPMVWSGNLSDIAHREAFREFVLSKTEDYEKPSIARLYMDWERYNRLYFDGALVVPYIMLITTGIPAAYGDCGPDSGFGGCMRIRIRRSLITGTHPVMTGGSGNAEGRYRFVSDVLLHEMIHQFQFEILHDWDESYKGHGPTFRDRANRIGETLKLGKVRIAKKRGKEKDLPSCAQFPHCVRPGDYYLGAYVLPNRDDGAEAHALRIIKRHGADYARELIEELRKATEEEVL